MNKMVSVIAYCVPICAENIIELEDKNIDSVLSVHCSSSGVGKFVIFRNEEKVATLFTSTKNLQAEYDIPFPCQYGSDRISILFINNDHCPVDMYATIQTEIHPRV